MRREEKRRKFNEAVCNMLYPPPPSPPLVSEDEQVPLNFELRELGGERESGSSATSGDDENDDGDGHGGSEALKLTRAQRKRLRKKRLKEDASRRKQVIGPLLPSEIDHGQIGPQGVRRNASEEPHVFADKPADHPPAQTQKNKVKQRRKAKKVAKEREQH